MFTKELIQAISDWQRGGDAKQKRRRGEALKEASRSLPREFRVTEAMCYRQIALNDPNLLNLGTKYQLPETISSWTEKENVAEEFKGGVPPNGSGYIGVIFKFCPAERDVVVNLSSLFKKTDFLSLLTEVEHEIDGFSQGIGKYGSTPPFLNSCPHGRLLLRYSGQLAGLVQGARRATETSPANSRLKIPIPV